MSDRLCTVLLYSDDPQVRDRMRLAVGTRPAPGLQIEFVDASDYAGCIRVVDEYEIDLMLLDGEASPGGGLGIARQIKDDRDDAPDLPGDRPRRRPLAGRVRRGRRHPGAPARPGDHRHHRGRAAAQPRRGLSHCGLA